MNLLINILIEEIKKKFDTDLNDFERIEVKAVVIYIANRVIDEKMEV